MESDADYGAKCSTGGDVGPSNIGNLFSTIKVDNF